MTKHLDSDIKHREVLLCYDLIKGLINGKKMEKKKSLQHNYIFL